LESANAGEDNFFMEAGKGIRPGIEVSTSLIGDKPWVTLELMASASISPAIAALVCLIMWRRNRFIYTPHIRNTSPAAEITFLGILYQIARLNLYPTPL
jgi:hypothetical protein